ncbi:dephospho-CoA kinase [Methylobacterium sp. sgz302541]|uniref:dephospho-CoA kinase n=1 Tax=unclassified Methylobacterium TaxID=2615210 RepID=UPI003D33734B
MPPRPSPLILGLTGSIGMGKSTTAAIFRDLGVPVHDADAAVADLYRAGGEVAGLLDAAFPGVLAPDGAVDRSALRAVVTADPDKLAELDAIVHPRVGETRRRFLAEHGETPVVVLDIPLLYETGSDRDCDRVAVVSAPAEVQRARVLSRDGMSPALLDAILARQIPDAEKRARADYVIDTGQGVPHAEAQVRAILDDLRDALR